MRAFLALLIFAAATPAVAAPVALFERYCVSCHDNADKKGDLSLEALKEFKDAKPETWALIREKLQLNQMPPKGKRQPCQSANRPMAMRNSPAPKSCVDFKRPPPPPWSSLIVFPLRSPFA